MTPQFDQAVIDRITSMFVYSYADIHPECSKPHINGEWIVATDRHVIMYLRKDYCPELKYPADSEGKFNTNYLHLSPTPDDVVSAIDVQDIADITGSDVAPYSIVRMNGVYFNARYIQRIHTLCRLAGASSVRYISHTIQSNNKSGCYHPATFQLMDGEEVVISVYLMPLNIESNEDLHDYQQTYNVPCGAIMFDDIFQIHPEAGLEAYQQLLADEAAAAEAYAKSLKVWNVKVAKTAWIPVQADTAQEAMKLANTHSSGVDDDLFDDSDVSVVCCESYPMNEDDVDELRNDRDHNRQGILTPDGWQSWSQFYGKDDPDDEYHQDKTSIKVTFGK